MRNQEFVKTEALRPCSSRTPGRDQIVEPIRVNPRLLERSVRTCLDGWRGLLTRQTRHGREFLRTVLTGPIAFTPLMDGAAKGYQFEGEASIGQLLSGVIQREIW